MGKWEMVKLGDVCELITDGTHQTPEYCNKSIGYPFLSSKNVTKEKIDWDDIKYIPKELHESLYKRLSPRLNDILLAKNGTTGVAALVDRDCVFDIYVSLALLRPKHIINPPYLLKAINNPYTKRQFQSHLKGIGVPNLHLSEIRETKIPLPPLPIQQKIADVLDRANTLIEKRKAQIEKLDLLVKSQFVEMFGDPVTNPMGWEVKTFSDISKVRQGLQIPISDRKTVAGQNRLKYITVQYLNGNKAEEYIENPRPNVICHENDILMTRTGNTGLVITGVYGVFHNNFFLIDFDKSVLSKNFLVYYLNTQEIQRELLRLAGTSTIPDLNHSDFYKIKIYLPPLELQNKFAAFVERVETQKSQMKKGFELMELGYKSLMQKCFNGEMF